ncbi:bifunctional oligoribonuclease/PAP phosphatase NrnA [Saccharibacillus sp. CPCC 101409]|uniref:DHH family phosphoesterase n=1 Tax=Saccharibacillus sp. CPCC 101409 TaxID=3058041 RepID=UPI002671FB2D|nr:bifunctional oligoribonuclease/PAP phosphatase NrnA [Saccharibacillus sp. CPCC 101409]MDO3410654.1 bifunctional oligoribonuclease/PAP phosphatase NrnA [Saccharibacillus sp. CPCC 101409]
MQTYEQELIEARRFIERHDDFLVVAHVQPDGDAVSSTLAVGWLLSRLGKTFTMINEGPIPQRMTYMDGAGQILDMSLTERSRTYGNVICVDCADFKRVGLVSQWMEDGANMLNIDHHPTNDRYGTQTLIKADAAATAEILYDLVSLFELGWDRNIAEMLYTGILTDTGGFRYSNTSPKVMQIASHLLELGVNGPELAESLLEQLTKPQFDVLTLALGTLQMSGDGKVAWVHVTPEHMAQTGAANEDLEGIVNYPRNIQGVEVGVLFKVINGSAVKASMRSAGKVDVAAVAAEFGGGGHVRAAGCRLEGPLEDAARAVIERIKQSL